MHALMSYLSSFIDPNAGFLGSYMPHMYVYMYACINVIFKLIRRPDRRLLGQLHAAYVCIYVCMH